MFLPGLGLLITFLACKVFSKLLLFCYSVRYSYYNFFVVVFALKKWFHSIRNLNLCVQRKALQIGRLCIVMLALPTVSVQVNLWQVKNFSGPLFSHSYKWIEIWFLTRSSNALFWRAQLFRIWSYFVKHRKVDLDRSLISGNRIDTFCSTSLTYHFLLKRWSFWDTTTL